MKEQDSPDSVVRNKKGKGCGETCEILMGFEVEGRWF